MIKLFKFLDTEVKLHWSLVIPFAITAPVWNHTLILLICFGVVILHEFGHILMARRYGIKCESVILSCIGGAAITDREPETPLSDFLVAICGPLVNVALLVLAIVAACCYELEAVPFWLTAFIVVNVFLIVFNAIPAFPMDGGRVLRSILWALLGREWADAICIALSMFLATFGVVYGLLDGMYQLALVSACVWLMAVMPFLSKMVGEREEKWVSPMTETYHSPRDLQENGEAV